MPYEHDHHALLPAHGVSRRALLAKGGKGLGALMLGTLLDACTPRSSPRDLRSSGPSSGAVVGDGVVGCRVADHVERCVHRTDRIPIKSRAPRKLVPRFHICRQGLGKLCASDN